MSMLQILKQYMRTNACWKEDAALSAASWFERVSSASNPADAPSRLAFDDPVLEGAVKVCAQWAVHEVAQLAW